MTIERHDRIEELAAEWDALADRSGARPWLRPGWIDAWWRAFGSGRLEVLSVARDGKLAGVLPVAHVRAGALVSPTNWHTPEFGPVAEDGAACEELATAGFETRPRRMALSFVSSDSPATDVLARAAAARGYRTSSRPQMRSPYVPVEGEFDAFVAAVGKPVRELRRRRRKLDEEGDVTVSVERGEDDRLDALLSEGFAVEGSGWKGEQGTAIASRVETRQFYTDVARWAAEAGMLRLFFLGLDGRAIAFELTFDDGRSLYDLKGGYDPAYRSYGPGMIMAYEMIAYAYREGRESFEFLGSEEPYKRDWTSHVRERIQFHAFAPSPAGLAAWALHAYGRPLAKRVAALRP